jgi:hypothetical protein
MDARLRGHDSLFVTLRSASLPKQNACANICVKDWTNLDDLSNLGFICSLIMLLYGHLVWTVWFRQVHINSPLDSS